MIGDEFLSVFLCLAGAYSLDVSQFFQRDGVVGTHVLQGGVLEDDIGGEVVGLGNFFPQVLEDGEEGAVEGGDASLFLDFLLILAFLRSCGPPSA